LEDWFEARVDGFCSPEGAAGNEHGAASYANGGAERTHVVSVGKVNASGSELIEVGGLNVVEFCVTERFEAEVVSQQKEDIGALGFITIK
jgi:hypothetical protein